MKLQTKLILCFLGVLFLGKVFILLKVIKKGSFKLNIEGSINRKEQIEES